MFLKVSIYRVTSVCLDRPGNVPRLALSAASFDLKITWICVDLRNTRCLQRRLIPAFVWMCVAAFDCSDNIYRSRHKGTPDITCFNFFVLNPTLFRSLAYKYANSLWRQREVYTSGFPRRFELWHSNCWGGQQPGTLSASEMCIWGKIHGDGRKFLDRFKSYFGSQI